MSYTITGLEKKGGKDRDRRQENANLKFIHSDFKLIFVLGRYFVSWFS